jgi:hypothetical protein
MIVIESVIVFFDEEPSFHSTGAWREIDDANIRAMYDFARTDAERTKGHWYLVEEETKDWYKDAERPDDLPF